MCHQDQRRGAFGIGESGELEYPALEFWWEGGLGRRGLGPQCVQNSAEPPEDQHGGVVVDGVWEVKCGGELGK